jgi:periplasmic protein TonB
MGLVANLEIPYRAVGDILARLKPLWLAMQERVTGLYDSEIAPRAARLSKRQWQAIAVVSVTLLHVLFIWMIVLSLRATPALPPPREMQLSLLRTDAKVVLPSVTLADPETPIVMPPDVVIEEEAHAPTIAIASPSQVLAPRPDPAHLNPAPAAADVGASIATALSVVLKILVMPDGSISDATVLRSCGHADADAGAMAYVKAKWRFLPALLDGKAIKYWTTVSVPIAPVG